MTFDWTILYAVRMAGSELSILAIHPQRMNAKLLSCVRIKYFSIFG